MNRPRPALLVLVAGVFALVAGMLGVAWAGSGTHVDSVGTRPTVYSSPSPLASPPNLRASTVSGEALLVGTPYRSLDRRDATQLPRPDRTPRPTVIDIPTIDVRVPVDVVGLDAAGQVQVPEDVMRSGWYRFSAKPGSGEGSTVIVGHVDGVRQGAGAFFRLRSLKPGDTVTLTRADDTRVEYVVVARERFSKDSVPLRDLFARTGPERLTLITCGGAFDPDVLGYTDNIVVTATPSDPSS